MSNDAPSKKASGLKGQLSDDHVHTENKIVFASAVSVVHPARTSSNRRQRQQQSDKLVTSIAHVHKAASPQPLLWPPELEGKPENESPPWRIDQRYTCRSVAVKRFSRTHG